LEEWELQLVRRRLLQSESGLNQSHGGNSDEVIQAFEEGLRYGRRGFMSLKELIEEYEAEPGRREELNKAREWLKKHLHATERTSSSDSGNARSSDISHEVERD
jgi:hypothetical protein